MFKRRLLFVVFGLGKARTFEKQHDADGHIFEFLHAADGLLFVNVLQLRIFGDLLFGQATHERKVQHPPRQTHDGHINQFSFEKESEKRCFAVEYRLQHHDVHPTLVVAHHQIRAIRLHRVGHIAGNFSR